MFQTGKNQIDLTTIGKSIEANVNNLDYLLNMHMLEIIRNNFNGVVAIVPIQMFNVVDSLQTIGVEMAFERLDKYAEQKITIVTSSGHLYTGFNYEYADELIELNDEGVVYVTSYGLEDYNQDCESAIRFNDLDILRKKNILYTLTGIQY